MEKFSERTVEKITVCEYFAAVVAGATVSHRHKLDARLTGNNIMNIECRKYKISRAHLREANSIVLGAHLKQLKVDAIYSFITFEKNDYRKAQLTFLFFDEHPPKVAMQVRFDGDIGRAILELIHLNTLVEWELVRFHFIPASKSTDNYITIEIIFNGKCMHVSCDGNLVLE